MATSVKHTADCHAQNANTLFGEMLCICEKPKRGKAAKVPKPPKLLNPCHGQTLTKVTVPTTHWGARHLFTPSTKQLAAYSRAHKHKVPQKRTEDTETGDVLERDTFDDEALRSLRLAYPKDALYPRIEAWRILQKALGTYVDKLRPGSALLGSDGRLHDRFRHTPKTLRLAMELLQVLPRPARGTLAADDPNRVYDAIRRCFVPAAGHSYVAADFSGIEPLLVAYLAHDPAYLRACRLGSHSWFTSTVIGKPVDIMGASDEDVLGHFAELAAGGPYLVQGKLLPWKRLRDGCKTTHMTSLYAGGPGEIARANPELFKDTKEVRYYQDALFALVPSVPRWHWDTAQQVDAQGYITAPSGFRLYGDAVIDRRYSKVHGWRDCMTRIAKELIAAVPQHLGMLYTATATLALADERPELAQYLRLLVHDEVFGEVPNHAADEFLAALVERMERPHPLLPLWPEASAVMGGATHLRVRTEVKRSTVSWGAM